MHSRNAEGICDRFPPTKLDANKLFQPRHVIVLDERLTSYGCDPFAVVVTFVTKATRYLV